MTATNLAKAIVDKTVSNFKTMHFLCGCWIQTLWLVELQSVNTVIVCLT